MSNKGFTLIELMIVLAIVGILAAVIVPALTEDSDLDTVTADKIVERTVETE